MTEAVTGAVLTIMKSREEIDLHMVSTATCAVWCVGTVCGAQLHIRPQLH